MSITGSEFQAFNGFPMPRDPQALVDRGRRPIVRSATAEPRFPFPVPNGWFIVAEAHELTPGETKAFYVFGTRRRAVPRRRRRAAHGRGVLRAPRRAHRRRRPRRRRLHPLPVPRLAVRRRQRQVQRDPLRRHGARAVAGADALVPLHRTQPDDLGVAPRRGRRSLLRRARGARAVRSRVVAVRDRRVRRRHLLSGDGREQRRLRALHVRARHRRDPRRRLLRRRRVQAHRRRDGNFVREGFGLGLGVLRVKGYTTFLSSTTPIDTENVKVRWIFTAPAANGPDAARQAAEGFSAGVSQDLPIWENKRYVERPVVTKSEKKLLEQRQWAKQFYSEATRAERAMTAWVGQYCIYVSDLERGGEVLRGARPPEHAAALISTRSRKRSSRIPRRAASSSSRRSSTRTVPSTWAMRSGSSTSRRTTSTRCATTRSPPAPRS